MKSMPTSISLESLKSQMPQAFVEAPSPHLSERYSFIPTHTILADLGKLGWKVREVVNPGYKSEKNQLHGKHLVRLFNPELHITKGSDVNFIEIALFNSSNGLSKFRLEVGIFRALCENGMVIKSEDFGSVNLRHKGYSFDSLKKSVEAMIARLPEVVGKINDFSAKVLTDVQVKLLASQAFDLRYGGRKATDADLADMLKVRRVGDEGSSLWTVFNRLQESLIRGGNTVVDARGRMREVKSVKNLDRSLKINQGLWSLAESFC